MTQSLSTHEQFMAQAIALANTAKGRTHPNPLVGCVIVHHGEVVARGCHVKAGQPHAEVMALAQLEAPAHECDLYVTLEPCCIHNRTPPCTEALIATKFNRIFVGSRDPNPLVDGKGIERLRDHGLEVITGILQKETDELLAPFAKRIITGLPLIALKYAMSLDGKIATHTGHSAWITNATSRAHVQTLRNHYDAILIGTGTLLADDPRLTCRLENGRSPARIILDAQLKAPVTSRVFEQDQTPVHVMTTTTADPVKQALLLEKGVHLHLFETNEDGLLPLDSILRTVAKQGFNSVLVEGGAAIHGALLDAGLADEVYAYIAPSLIGGQNAPGPIAGQGVELATAAVRLDPISHQILDGDILIHGKVPPESRAFPIPHF